MGRPVTIIDLAFNRIKEFKKNAVKEVIDGNFQPTCDYRLVEQAKTMAKFIHTQEDRWIALALKRDKRMLHYHVKFQDLNDNIGKFADVVDAYCSVNSFHRIPRDTEYLWKLNAFYCDIDFYNRKDLRHYTVQQVFQILQQDYFDKVVPYPNLIISSGRGLNLFWVIEPVPATAKAFRMWTKLQQKFLELLQPVGGDANSIDGARIFRIPGSVNKKSGQHVEVLEQKAMKYTMRDLSNKYLPPLIMLVPTKNKGWKIPASEKKKNKHFFNLRTLHYSRMQDIVKLQKMRVAHNDPDMKKGLREVMCFLYRYWCNCYYGNQEKVEIELQKFNANFIEPLKEEELKCTSGADKFHQKWLSNFDEHGNIQVQHNSKYKYKGYNYSNAKLIKVLKISLEEQIDLSTIISKEEKKRRHQIQRADKKERGPTKREQQTLANISKVQAAVLEYPYFTQQKIAEITGLSQSRVSKILMQLNSGKFYS